MPNLLDSVEKATEQLTSLKKKLSDIDGEHTYTFKQLFNDEFMQTHTKYPDISSFLHESGFDFSSQESFQNIDKSELDKYISTHSDFDSWHDMKLAAAKEITSKQLKD